MTNNYKKINEYQKISNGVYTVEYRQKIQEELNNHLDVLPEDFIKGIKEITKLAEDKKFDKLANTLDLDQDIIKKSAECVGDGQRKGNIDGMQITHFSHMVRVAYMMKYFFPDDELGRKLAITHDAKEEASEGKENNYKEIEGLDNYIDMLTEEEASEKEIEEIKNILINNKEELDPKYIAKYKKYIATLNKNWNTIGNMELCDRLDGSISFDYLYDDKYNDRLRSKLLESFGRIYATIENKENKITNYIKSIIRKNIKDFNKKLKKLNMEEISEEDIIHSSKYFL